MITHSRLNDFSSVYKSYLNSLNGTNSPGSSNSDGYSYYRFVSSPDGVVTIDFGRVKSADITGNIKTIWSQNPGTNTPNSWKLKFGAAYSNIKRQDYYEIEGVRTSEKPGPNISSVTPGLSYTILPLINISPTQPDPFLKNPVPTPTSNSPSGPNYIKNMQTSGISSTDDFLNAVVKQKWLDSFRTSDAMGTTTDFSSYSTLFKPITDTKLKQTIENNAIGVEWFGYFKPPDLSTQYSFTFSTSNGGNFMMWLGNKAICEYTPANSDIIYPNVEFTPKPPLREPKYYPMRIQYYGNSNNDTGSGARNFSFNIINNTTKNSLDLTTSLFTINEGNYLPKLQYLAFVSTSKDLFANGSLSCYNNDITTNDRVKSFYDFINSKKYETLKKQNDQDPKTNIDQFGIIKGDGSFFSEVSDPNNPLSLPVVFSIYRLDVDMRMNKTFQITTIKDPVTNSYRMNEVEDSLVTLGSTYTTLPNYYPDNPSAGINATAEDCKKQCTGSSPGASNCNWFYAYQSNGVDRCLLDNKGTQPIFNQIRPTGGNTANSSVDDKTSSLNLRNYAFPKSKGCGPNSILLEDSDPVLSTQIYTDSFPYSTYVIDPRVIKTTKNAGKCSDPTYLKLNAEAKNIISVNTLYNDDGTYKHRDGSIRASNYPSYDNTNFWSTIQEGFSETTNAMDDTKSNTVKNIAKEQRLENTNANIHSTYANLSTNIQNYNTVRTFMENDVNYDLSGNTLLYFRNKRIPTLREQNALDSNDGGFAQNSLYILGTITATSLLILAVFLGKDS